MKLSRTVSPGNAPALWITKTRMLTLPRKRVWWTSRTNSRGHVSCILFSFDDETTVSAACDWIGERNISCLLHFLLCSVSADLIRAVKHWQQESLFSGKNLIELAKIIPLARWFHLSWKVWHRFSPSGCCAEVLPPVRATGNRTTEVILSLHSPRLPRSFHPNWLPVGTTSCWQERKLWLQSLFFFFFLFWKRLEDAMFARLSQSKRAEEAFEWITGSLLPLCILSSSSDSILLLLTCLPRQWMESIPLTNVGGLSNSEEVKCLLQLPEMKGFGGALAFCNSNGLFQPDDLICSGAVSDGLLRTSPAPKAAACGGDWRVRSLDNCTSCTGLKVDVLFTTLLRNHVHCYPGIWLYNPSLPNTNPPSAGQQSGH